jgi:hypothetical protein
MINLNNTKIEDINNILGIAQHGDLKIVFNKSDNFICCAVLCKILNESKYKNINRFFKLDSIVEILGDGNNEVSKLYYKLTKKDVKTDGDYTGYYIN